MLDMLKRWEPPDSWSRITVIDAHAGGEPLRVVAGGFPPLAGDTILARRRFVKQHADHLRTALMFEPRGHREMYGCLLTPPVSESAHFGVLFMHNEGYSTMCGHGIIAVVTVAVETGLVHVTEADPMVRIDTPAGLVTARVNRSGHRVHSVAFRNVPSFVVALDQTVDMAGLGRVRYDLAFGGAFYAYVQAEDLGLGCVKEDYQALIDYGMVLKRAIAATRPIAHPFESDLNFLYGTIFIGRSDTPGVHSRNVCVFANGQIDRSPTGTGVSGRMAIHYARGEIRLKQSLTIESIVGSRFRGTAVEAVRFGGYDAIVPEVEGSGHITGRAEILLDPADELRHGFLLQ